MAFIGLQPATAAASLDIVTDTSPQLGGNLDVNGNALVSTANGNIQIDSATTNKGLIIIDSGTGSVTPKVHPDKELVFAKPTATSGQVFMATTRSAKDANGELTYSFKKENGTALNVDFVIAKVSNQITASSSGYGVQIYNDEGDLAFDSGAFTGDGGIGITDFVQAYESTGQNDLIDTDTSKYSLVNSTNWADPNDTGVSLAFIYVLTTNLEYSSTGIYFEGRFQFKPFGEAVQYQTISNLGAIFLAEVGTV